MTAIDFKELRQYESFKNIEEMDKSIHEYIEYIRHDVPQSVIDVLWCLGGSSLRCVGLSFMKQATIAKETGYTRKTVNKALKTLESLGIVDSVRTKTKSGRPSVKVMRILPFCLERLQQGVTSYKGEETNGDNGLTLIDKFEPFQENHSSIKREDNKVHDQEPIESISIDDLDSSFIPDTIVAKKFVQAAKPFFKVWKIYRLWGIVKNAMNQAKLTLSKESIEATIEAFKTSVFAYKAGRIKSTFENYFFGVLSSMLAPIRRREVAATSEGDILFYDWLNDANNDTEGDNTIYFD
ncbi:hypothetical protein C6W27_09040 [Bacillus paralicheniformis]|uniref:helix-turn-helix transcriptional regulator n=1 Tax=Bacillus paralicheniformis TaxID=1648923 RepID=UPI000D042522|nr:helix-turn-helix domain-containing protein [Bacillus paralicheniformis]PRS16536.1 hypothetical protein C6W27_09040 [Bacillus paralicheniformis]